MTDALNTMVWELPLHTIEGMIAACSGFVVLAVEQSTMRRGVVSASAAVPGSRISMIPFDE